MPDSTNWERLPKPWSMSQCRDRYVMGPRIGLRSLAEISGVPFDTIADSSRNQGWVTQREKFKGESNKKTGDLVSSQIAKRTAAIFNDHYSAELEVFEVGKNIVALAKIYTQSIRDRFEALQNAPSDDDKQSRGNAYELQALTASLNLAQSTIEGAINGQRKALGLDYSDINYAVSSVRRSGLEVVDKNDFELFKKYLAAQASNQDTEDPDCTAVQVSTLEVVAPSKSANS